MIRRPSDAWDASILEEYRRLAKVPGTLVEFIVNPIDPTRFKCVTSQAVEESRIGRYCRSGQDYAGLLGIVQWLREGPKIVDVTQEQYEALSRVEVRLAVADFRMPYNTVLVNMPPGGMHEYVILHMTTIGGVTPTLVGTSISHDHTHDVVTVIRHAEGEVIDTTLGTFHGSITEEEGGNTHRAMRVACNMLLAMTHYGCHAAYAFPAEVEQERKYIAKGDRPSRNGRTASDRLREQPVIVTLDREVRLWHRSGGHGDGTPTGRTAPFHWRRGHWRMAHVGAGRAERRAVFVRPCMVRADLMSADPTDTTTTYINGRREE